MAANPDEVVAVKKHVKLPVYVGSGVTADNVGKFAAADGLIVGTELKVDGKWQNPLDPSRIQRLTQHNK